MNIRICISFFLLFLISASLQDSHPKDYFRSPVDITISLSGNFGDFRTNHFHSGIDIRTQGVIGKKIYASAEGYISRLRISPYGYGNAVYITHPNGYTSLYGHLNQFNKEIQEYIHQKQYDLELNTIDYALKENEMLVSKGDVIGLGGNSGSSSGPHLHFEIRDTKTEQPLNPMLFGLDIPDDVKPEIYELFIYPADDWSTVNGKHEVQSFIPKKIGNNYTLNQDIIVNGRIGIGLYALDRFKNGKYKHTFYELSMSSNGEEHYHFKYDALDFETLRDVNCHMDLGLKLNERKKVTKCFKAPHSRLDFYSTLNENGFVDLAPDSLAEIQIKVNDIVGNEAKVNFKLQGSTNSIRQNSGISFDKKLKAESENSYYEDETSLYFPDKRLYNDVKINVENNQLKRSTTISPIHTPLKDWFRLKMEIPSELIGFSEKVIICQVRKNGRIKALESYVENNEVSCKTKEFGTYKLMIDTLAPTIIKASSFSLKKVTFKVDDNFSQIANYTANIDDQWLRIFYDAKADLFVCRPEELNLTKGKHTLRIEVSDLQGNKEIYKTTFEN